MKKTQSITGVFDTDYGLIGIGSPDGTGFTRTVPINPSTGTIDDPVAQGCCAWGC